MGLFDGRVEIRVASSVYNLAGDENDRPEVMRSIILRSVLSDRDISIGQAISSSLRKGTGAQLRDYYRWAQNNYALDFSGTIDEAPDYLNLDTLYTGLRQEITEGPEETLEVRSATIGSEDAGFFVDAYVMENRPDLVPPRNVDPIWTADYDRQTQELILKVPGETDTRFPAPSDFLWAGEYTGNRLLYVVYQMRIFNPPMRTYEYGPTQTFTHRLNLGSNAALDTLDNDSISRKEFFPVIPVRVWNEFADTAFSEEIYDSIKKAYNRLTGSRFSELVETLEDNDNLGDIDHAFVIPGVDLGTKDNTGKEYLFRFFQELRNSTTLSPQDHAAYEDYVRTKHNQDWTNQIFDYTHPLYGTTPDTQRTFMVPAPAGQIRVNLEEHADYSTILAWNYITESDRLGNCKRYDGVQRDKAKKGDFWIIEGPAGVVPAADITSETNGVNWNTQPVSRLLLFHQYSKRRYRMIEVFGAKHYNFVYKGYQVQTEVSEALNVAEGETSNFLVPLHYPTFKSMGLAKNTQLSGHVSHLVLNSYEEVKIKWYQTGMFQKIMIIGTLAMAFLTGGGSLLAGGGILGTNVAVGATVGLSGTVGALVGAAANYLAAVVVTELVSYGAKELFGDEWGAIIGSIASFVALSAASSMASGNGFNFDFSSLMKVDNLLQITNSASKSYSSYLQGETEDIMNEMEGLDASYEERFEEVEELTQEILGMTNGLIDPMMFTDASEYFGESSEAFLARTLLTGTDIARLSHTMIEDFADVSLELPKAIR